MAYPSLISELVEHALEEGLSAEDVCRETPDCLPEVRRRLGECRALASALDDMFGERGPAESRDGDLNGAGSVDGPTRAFFDGVLRSRELADDLHAGGPLPRVPGYRIEGVIGRGGMGVVYRAVNLRLNRPVAMKTLKAGVYATPAERSRFLREGRALAALRHPHVVPVYDAGEEGGRPYYTMELVEGGSLASRLAGAPLAAAEAARLVEAVAAAVQAAHDAGIVHRDLKPGNVLLTTDGTPKVADFGLVQSRISDIGESELTLAGQRLGTPSYMAPEQASPRWGDVGPVTDVYGIGAILYETLTGRPPFRGDSPSETERQLLADDPVPPRRLNPRVPRDLETICLKCLHKSQTRRYPSAAAVAEDLGCTRRGEPIDARRVGQVERAAKWVRRRPTAAALWTMCLLVTLVGFGGVLWWVSEAAATARAVAADLDEAVDYQRQARWAEANAAFDRAELRLGERGLASLRARLERGRRDAALVAQLEEIRAKSARSSGGAFNRIQASTEYTETFRRAGFVIDGSATEAAAAWINESNVRSALVTAIYHWTHCTPHRDLVTWLLQVMTVAEPDAAAWHDRAYSANVVREPSAAAETLTDPTLPDQAPELLLLVAERLDDAGHDPNPFLARVHQAYPADFWVNIAINKALDDAGRHAEAIRFAQAAVALRPESAIAHDYLGGSLRHAGHLEEALVANRRALKLDPESPFARANIAAALAEMGQHDEASREYRKCLEARPDDISFHRNLGISLEKLGRLDEAEHHYRQAIAQGPAPDTRHLRAKPKVFAAAQTRLRNLLLRQGRHDEALEVWRRHFESPTGSDDMVFDGYAEYRLYSGHEAEYRRVRAVLLDRAEASSEPRHWEIMGRACLLLPPSRNELRRATALIDRAVATTSRSDTYYPYFRAAKGLAEYRAGRYEEAIGIMEGDAADALWTVPQMVVAMSQARLGRSVEARRTLAGVAMNFDWSLGWRTETGDFWMYHILRREAEAMILPNLPAFLEQPYLPPDHDERLALMGACQVRERYATHARLWADAIAADPSLTKHPGHQFALQSAILAGLGRGTDVAGLTEADRNALRLQAHAWFRSVLATASGTDPSVSRAARDESIVMLESLLRVPDLAIVRDPEHLSGLPTAEQQAWAELWKHAKRLVGTPPQQN